jgi:hypothetical protein
MMLLGFNDIVTDVASIVGQQAKDAATSAATSAADTLWAKVQPYVEAALLLGGVAFLFKLNTYLKTKKAKPQLSGRRGR